MTELAWQHHGMLHELATKRAILLSREALCADLLGVRFAVLVTELAWQHHGMLHELATKRGTTFPGLGYSFVQGGSYLSSGNLGGRIGWGLGGPRGSYLSSGNLGDRIGRGWEDPGALI